MDKKAIITEWIEALESEEYQQTTGALRYEGKFCCLGVFCDLQAKKGAGFWDGTCYSSAGDIAKEDERSGSLPNDERKLLLNDDEDLEDRFIAMNDQEKKSFKEIAAVARRLLLGENNEGN